MLACREALVDACVVVYQRVPFAVVCKKPTTSGMTWFHSDWLDSLLRSSALYCRMRRMALKANSRVLVSRGTNLMSCSASCVDVCVDGATTFRSPDCSIFMCDPQLHTRDVHVQRRPMTHARMTLTVAVMRPPLVVSAASASSACSAAER